MLGDVFERFVEKSPISVMVRGTLERVLGPDPLDLWYERTAKKQYTRTLLFSTVYDLMSQVVFRLQPSVHAAYRAQEAQVGTSVVSVYNKLQEIEPHTSAALVRYSAHQLAPLIEQLGGDREPWLHGYQVKIIDGNCLEASEHRLEVLRRVDAGALPGKSLVVYAPDQGLVRDVFPCEDGHAQERSLFDGVLKTVQAGDLWIADRNFCTRDFLCDIDHRGAGFIIRQHRGLPFEIRTPLRPLGRMETGQMLLYILTNVPARKVSAKRVAQLYRKRWTLETAFQHLEAYFHSEINTLGYPKAALFGFSLALVAYNLLAVVLAALRGVHGQDKVDAEVSLYYIANEISTTYNGMMIAIPEAAWDVFARMSAPDMVATLRDLAQRVDLRAYRKSPRGPKRAGPKHDGSSKQGHVSTAKLLIAQYG